CGEHLVALDPGDTTDRLYGVAVDVGTTTVVGTLMNLATGEVEAVSATLNRQATFGGDVISRIAHTMADADGLATLQRLALETLNDILSDLYRQSGVSRENVYEALLVGNSTMLHLFLGVDARSISVAPFVPVFDEAVELAATEVGLSIHPEGRVGTLPLIGAYVGADTVAGIHATDLARDDRVRLFIDVGTNSEIALGSSAGVVATSAPAGPAFEGAQIRHGMTATAGAIERVVMGDSLEIEVIGGGEPRGICGSGLIDVVAGLRRSGLVDASGRMAGGDGAPDHPLHDRLGEVEGVRAFVLAGNIVLTQRDIRELQAAMSSVATGVRVLLERVGLEAGDVEEVMLAGSFGSAIDPESARVIGLVPPVPVEKIRFVGNVAAEGAKMSLLSFRERRVACDLKSRVEYVELSERPDFNELFVAGVRFPDLAALS
ncbi:MAG: ASKHA domain-containing protein, partial [Thermoanaerobaculia bacterium]